MRLTWLLDEWQNAGSGITYREGPRPGVLRTLIEFVGERLDDSRARLQGRSEEPVQEQNSLFVVYYRVE